MRRFQLGTTRRADPRGTYPPQLLQRLWSPCGPAAGRKLGDDLDVLGAVAPQQTDRDRRLYLRV
jgi:hypothetical protein